MTVVSEDYRLVLQQKLKDRIEAQVSDLTFHAPVPSDRSFPYITVQQYNEDDLSDAETASWLVTPHLMLRDGGPVDAFADDTALNKASEVRKALSNTTLDLSPTFRMFDVGRVDTDDSPRRYEDDMVYKSVLILPRYYIQYTP